MPHKATIFPSSWSCRISPSTLLQIYHAGTIIAPEGTIPSPPPPSRTRTHTGLEAESQRIYHSGKLFGEDGSPALELMRMEWIPRSIESFFFFFPFSCASEVGRLTCLLQKRWEKGKLISFGWNSYSDFYTSIGNDFAQRILYCLYCGLALLDS